MQVLNAWYGMFKDDDFREVNRAAITYICTQNYPPTVAGLKTIMAENRMAGQMTEMQAWNKIRKAINDAGSRNDAIEAFSKLPSILQKLVCEPAQLRQWRVCDDNTLEGVIASNAQRSYRELARREAVWYTIPGQLQQEQTWRVDAPGPIALPEPEVRRSVSEIVEHANAKASEHGMIMTDELREKHSGRLDAFIAPMTAEEKKIVAKREEMRAERYLK